MPDWLKCTFFAGAPWAIILLISKTNAAIIDPESISSILMSLMGRWVVNVGVWLPRPPSPDSSSFLGHLMCLGLVSESTSSPQRKRQRQFWRPLPRPVPWTGRSTILCLVGVCRAAHCVFSSCALASVCSFQTPVGTILAPIRCPRGVRDRLEGTKHRQKGRDKYRNSSVVVFSALFVDKIYPHPMMFAGHLHQ